MFLLYPKIIYQSNIKQVTSRYPQERVSDRTLINIPLRSMLINAVVPQKDTRNRSGAKRRLTYTSTGYRKSATRDFDLLVSYHLAYTSGFNKNPMLFAR